MFFGAISSAMSGGSFWRRVRFRRRNRHRPLRLRLADHVLVQLGDDLARRQRFGVVVLVSGR
jgi:hypothetical protein